MWTLEEADRLLRAFRAADGGAEMSELRIVGEGLLPLTLSFQQLDELPGHLAHRSQLFGGAELIAVPLGSILRRVHPPSSARFVTLRSQDGYATTVALADVNDAFLVYRLGSGPLTQERGGPFRLVIDPAQPQRCLKHVTTIEVLSTPAAEHVPTCHHHADRAA
jgi:DMSO/TMAO reductase YedYZ molybdopterin-dependent catalytic subunit